MFLYLCDYFSCSVFFFCLFWKKDTFLEMVTMKFMGKFLWFLNLEIYEFQDKAKQWLFDFQFGVVGQFSGLNKPNNLRTVMSFCSRKQKVMLSKEITPAVS